MSTNDKAFVAKNGIIANGAVTINSTAVYINNIPISANGSIGSNNQVLTTNGTSNFWANVASSSAAGSNTQIQFNDSGSSNGSSGLTFNKLSNNVSVSNSISATGSLIVGNSTVNVVSNSSSLYFSNSNPVQIYRSGGRMEIQAGVNTASNSYSSGFQFKPFDGPFTNSTSGSNYPSLSHYWTYTSNTNPSDLTYAMSIDGLGSIPAGIRVYSGSNSGIDIINSGNVGISNSAPADKLSVGGTAYVSGNTRIGVNTGAYSILTVSNSVNAPSPASNSMIYLAEVENSPARIRMISANNTTTVVLSRYGNTFSAPAGLANNTVIGRYAFESPANTSVVKSFYIEGKTTEAWTGNTTGSALGFFGYTIGSNTITESMRLYGSNGVSIGDVNVIPAANSIHVGNSTVNAAINSTSFSLNGVALSSGQPIPTSSSDYRVGSVLLVKNKGSSVNDGSTIAGSSLKLIYLDTTTIGGGAVSVVETIALSGTWKNISGGSVGIENCGYFVRTV